MMMDEDCDFKSLMDIFENEEELLGSDLSLGAMDFQGLNDKEPIHSNKRRRSRLSGLFGSSNDGEMSIKRRLRSASEVFKKGMLSTEEKKVLTERLLSKDARFAQEFDQAKETGNWDRLRQALHTQSATRHSARRSSLIMSALGEGEEPLQEAFLTEDLSAVFDSTGIMSQKPPPKKKGRPRKYPASQTKKAGLSKKDKGDQMKKQTKKLLKREKLAGSPISLKGKGVEASCDDETGQQGSSKSRQGGSRRGQLSKSIKLENSPPKPPISSLSHGSAGKKNGASDVAMEIRDLQKHGSKSTRESVHKAKASLEKYGVGAGAHRINKQFNKGRRSDSFTFESDKDAKFRKNERERRRRLMVSQGFSDLVTVLNLPETAKVDKATVLNNSIRKIETLQQRVQELELEIKELKSPSTKTSRKA